MSISGCYNCIGSGWFPRGNYRSSGVKQAGENWPPGIPEPWERCWCDYGVVGFGHPAYWKDRDSVQRTFYHPYEDLESAVSSFLAGEGSDPEKIKIVKFYIAQWVMKDPFPPPDWMEKLAKTSDWQSLKEFTAWLEEHLIAPF